MQPGRETTIIVQNFMLGESWATKQFRYLFL